MSFFQALADILETPEGLERCRKFMLKFENRDKIEASQLERFRKNFAHRFDEIVTKIQNKYESDEYYHRHMDMGMMPPEDLYHFLYKYAQEYGKDVFGSYLIHDYIFEQIHGQGTVIEITKNI